jgi:hypothetical protein
METFDTDHNLFTRQNAGDETLFVVFYLGIIKNEGRSIAEGRAIFDDVECVRIIVPGDKNSVVDRPASEQDKRRFARQYDLFQKGAKEDEQVSGTRLSDWPYLSRAQAEELRYLGIKTVEQLASVRDDITSRVPGLVALKQHASVWLAKATKSAEAAQFTKALQDATSRVESLEEVVRDQASRIEKLLEAKKEKA